VCGKRERRGGERGEGVAKNSERLAAFQAVGEVAARELGEAGEAVGDTFYRAEPRRSRANESEECGQDSCGRFVTPVREKAGEADAEDGAVEPVFVSGGFRHAAVYLRSKNESREIFPIIGAHFFLFEKIFL